MGGDSIMGEFAHIGYFPFCLTKGTPPETGKGTDYPISLPLTQYMSWWWKVKTWELTGSSTGRERWSNDGYNNWTTTGLVQDIYWTGNVSTQKQLVCLNLRFISHGFNGISDPQGPFTNTSFIQFFPEGYINGTTVYPKMILSGWYSTIPGHPKVQAALDPVSTLSIDGINIPCHIFWIPGQRNDPEWGWSGRQKFELTPKTYWE